jgi:hypothetical protein
MIKTLIEKVIGTRQQRDVRKLTPLLADIHRHEERLATLSEAELQGQTAKLRGRVDELIGAKRLALQEIRDRKRHCEDPAERAQLDEQAHQLEREYKRARADALNEVLSEAFATVREACRRLMGTKVMVTGRELEWDMVPYDVQLIGGIVLHRGRIAEMATGEGKTLVATLPLYLNALAGHGAHLVTVNNYLARRDSQWMGHVYGYLGLTVGCIDDTQPSTPERRAAYLCDITYGTNNEFGFDYLRDNMVFTLEHRVQREYAYAIVDEVDSILIDEARTPLIISGPVGNEGDDKYAVFNRQVSELVRRQTAVVNQLVAEAEPMLEDEKRKEEAAAKLFQAQLGMPKNKRLLKLMNETGVKQLVQRAELDYIGDRKLPSRQQKMRGLEEALYYVLDEKGHSVHLTDKGAAAMLPDEPELFLVPDISQEIHQVEKDPTLSVAERRAARAQIEADYAVKSEKLHIIHKLLQAHSLYARGGTPMPPRTSAPTRRCNLRSMSCSTGRSRNWWIILRRAGFFSVTIPGSAISQRRAVRNVCCYLVRRNRKCGRHRLPVSKYSVANPIRPPFRSTPFGARWRQRLRIKREPPGLSRPHRTSVADTHARCRGDDRSRHPHPAILDPQATALRRGRTVQRAIDAERPRHPPGTDRALHAANQDGGRPVIGTHHEVEHLMDPVTEINIPDAAGPVHHVSPAGAPGPGMAGEILLADVGLRLGDHPRFDALGVESPHQMLPKQPAGECNRFFLPEYLCFHNRSHAVLIRRFQWLASSPRCAQ